MFLTCRLSCFYLCTCILHMSKPYLKIFFHLKTIPIIYSKPVFLISFHQNPKIKFLVPVVSWDHCVSNDQAIARVHGVPDVHWTTIEIILSMKMYFHLKNENIMYYNSMQGGQCKLTFNMFKHHCVILFFVTF